MNRVYLGGIQGVGKDSVIEKVSGNYGLEVINFAEMMKEISKADYSHDALLRELAEQERVLLRTRVLEELATKHNIIVNGHYALPIRSSRDENIKYFEEGIPTIYYDLFDLYLLIETSPENVRDRRLKDKTRKRDTSLSNIILELEQERNYFNRILKKGHMGYIVTNDCIEIANIKLDDVLQKKFKDMSKCGS